MKKIMKLAVISSFVALGIATANAQVVVLPVNFALSGFKQSGDTATTVRLSNKDMFNALNENGSGLSIGRSARLVAIEDTDGNITGFQTREHGATNDVSGSITVGSSDITVTGKNVQYTILTFSFSDGNGNDFTVSGYATIRKGKATGHGVDPILNIRIGAAVQVSGTGHIGGDPAVFRGTISASGAKAEAQ